MHFCTALLRKLLFVCQHCSFVSFVTWIELFLPFPDGFGKSLKEDPLCFKGWFSKSSLKVSPSPWGEKSALSWGSRGPCFDLEVFLICYLAARLAFRASTFFSTPSLYCSARALVARNRRIPTFYCCSSVGLTAGVLSVRCFFIYSFLFFLPLRCLSLFCFVFVRALFSSLLLYRTRNK